MVSLGCRFECTSEVIRQAKKTIASRYFFLLKILQKKDIFPQKNAFKVGIDYYFVLSSNNEGLTKLL